MTALSAVVEGAIDTLCSRFEEGDYNPTPIIDLGVLVANADGRIDAQEVEALSALVQTLLGERLSAELVGYLVQASVEVIEKAGADPRARLVAEILLDCCAVEEGLIVALAVAFASEGLSPEERDLISTIARAADYPAEKLEPLIEQVRSATAGRE